MQDYFYCKVLSEIYQKVSETKIERLGHTDIYAISRSNYIFIYREKEFIKKIKTSKYIRERDLPNKRLWNICKNLIYEDENVSLYLDIKEVYEEDKDLIAFIYIASKKRIQIENINIHTLTSLCEDLEEEHYVRTLVIESSDSLVNSYKFWGELNPHNTYIIPNGLIDVFISYKDSELFYKDKYLLGVSFYQLGFSIFNSQFDSFRSFYLIKPSRELLEVWNSIGKQIDIDTYDIYGDYHPIYPQLDNSHYNSELISFLKYKFEVLNPEDIELNLYRKVTYI